jgi:hypothetical protein
MEVSCALDGLFFFEVGLEHLGSGFAEGCLTVDAILFFARNDNVGVVCDFGMTHCERTQKLRRQMV